jgi:hypothetical protein
MRRTILFFTLLSFCSASFFNIDAQQPKKKRETSSGQRGKGPPRKPSERLSISASTERTLGLQTALFKLPSGEIAVNLPEDMGAGDRISGTVVPSSSGRTEAERRQNSDELTGYVVAIEKEETPVSGTVVMWRIPQTLGGTDTHVILKAMDGREIGRTPVTVHPEYPRTPRPQPLTARDYQLPEVAQSGRPFVVRGVFDGDIWNTDARVGGVEARKLAESPRKATFESPAEKTGKQTVEIAERWATVRGETNFVRVQLEAAQTTLKEGEQTSLKIKLEGLQSVRSSAYLHLWNPMSEVVTLEGGNDQTLQIPPAEIARDGTYATARTLTGNQPGPFTIRASIIPRDYVQVAFVQEKGDSENEIPWWVHIGSHFVSKTLGTALLLLDLKGDTMPPRAPAPEPKKPKKPVEMCCYEVKCCCDQDLSFPNLTEKNMNKPEMKPEELFKAKCAKEWFNSELTLVGDDPSTAQGAFAAFDKCKNVFDYVTKPGDPPPRNYNPTGLVYCERGKLKHKGSCENK